MKRAWLKKIRKVLAIAVFVYTLVVFLDFTGSVPEKYRHGLTFIQFTPSLIEFIHLLSITSVGFLIVVILSLLFGRVYCSTICPAGTIQDVVIFAQRKIRKKQRFHYLKSRNGLRISILALVLLSVLAGSMALLNLLDPYSLSEGSWLNCSVRWLFPLTTCLL